MTSVPPTQPPAAPETDVRLTEAERKSLWRVIAGVRDGAARLPNDADTEDIIDAILDSGWIYRLVAERVRVVEGERDAARAEVAEVRYELGDALTTLETALMGTPSNGCAWSVVGAPACHAGTREHSFWCRHCLVRSTAATTARAESAEAAHRALQAAVEALADEWEADQDRTWIASLADDLRDLLAREAR